MRSTHTLAIPIILSLFSSFAHPAEPTPEQASVIAEIKKLGGTVRIEPRASVRTVVSVQLYDSKAKDGILKKLQVFPELQAISLSRSEITDEGMSDLARCEQLRIISLPKAITDKGLEALKPLKKVESLGLVRTKVTSKGLAALEKMEELRDLRLNYTTVDDEMMPLLKSWPKLERLSLNDTKITDKGLVHLTKCKNLKTLGLEGTAITDKGAETLATMTQLEQLWINRTQISKEGLKLLKEKLRNTRIVCIQ